MTATLPTRVAPMVAPLQNDCGTDAFASPARWKGCPAAQLEDHGYRVDEFLLSGEAYCYTSGGFDGAQAHGEPAPYTTRALVVRPRDAAAFSGNVVVELLNPSLRFDLSMHWSDIAGLAMGDGDVWVGVTFKKVAIETLRQVDFARYASLRLTDDRHSMDLIVDTLRESRRSGEDALLGDLPTPMNIILTGGSQSGSKIRSFIADGFHEPAMQERAATADGYLIQVSSGGFGALGYVPVDRNQQSSSGAFADYWPHQSLSLDDPRRFTRALEVPVVDWLSESEGPQHFWVTRPDASGADEKYRCYEIAGVGHSTGMLGPDGLEHDLETMEAAGIDISVAEHRRPKRPDVPADEWERDTRREWLRTTHEETAFLKQAVLGMMRRWRAGGAPLPPSRYFILDPDVAAGRDESAMVFSGPRSRRDRNGHSWGGVRYPTIDHAIEWFRPADPTAIVQDYVREPMPLREVIAQHGSIEQWRRRAEESLETCIAEGFVREDHRDAFRGLLDARLAACPRDEGAEAQS